MTPAAARPPYRGRARVGCSGWSYDDWRGLVYPADLPRKDWFAHYASLFGTAEINSWFYRLPKEATVEGWARQAPEGFTYAVKLGQFGSHRKKLRDATQWLPNHLDRLDRLGASAGPTLVQLPPRWKRNAERLDEFLAAWPRDRRVAVELRDPSWVHDEVFAVLERHRAALCLHDLLADHPLIRTTDWTYVRFHGPAARERPYHDRYGPDALEPLAALLEEWRAGGSDVYAYFNNDWDGAAVDDGRWLAERLTSTA